jgi:hypothetical protein
VKSAIIPLTALNVLKDLFSRDIQMELLLAPPLAPQGDMLTQTMFAKIASQDASTAIITTLATNVISATSR